MGVADRKSTPGPWEFIGKADSDYYGEGAYLVEERSSDCQYIVAAAIGDVQALAGRAKQNARLIAAAPDLLKALEGLLRGILLNDQDGLSEHAECVTAARAAIAKATDHA